MHILLLNEYYPPDTSATAKMAEMVVEILASRHRITVVAGRPSYDPTERFSWRLLRREGRGNISVERVGSTAFHRFKMIRRMTNYLTYVALAIPRAMMIRSDVVLSMTDPPFVGIAGAIISRFTGRPFIYNIRDLYPDMAVGGGIMRPGFAVRIWERMHCWALRHAARVIVLGDDMRERIIKKGVNPDRIPVVRDGVTIPQELPDPANPVTQEIRRGFEFVALHAGNIGFYGAWDTLVAAARHLSTAGTGIVFVGEGAQKDRLIAAAKNMPAIRFLPFRPASDIPLVLAAGDVHIITVKRGLEGVIVPSKLYPILAAGKPVLAVSTMHTDVARIITEGGCGVVADPDDPNAVAKALDYLATHPERVAEMAQRARAIARNYDKFAELNRFLTVIEGVVQE